MPLLQPPSRPPPDTPGGVIVDILAPRLDPVVFQHGIDVMVPDRVLSAVQQIRQLIEGQVSPLTEAENHHFDAFSRRFSQRADRFRNLMECSLMFGVPGKCSEFPANVRSSRQMFGARPRTDPGSSEHFIPHRVVAGPVVESVSAASIGMNVEGEGVWRGRSEPKPSG